MTGLEPEEFMKAWHTWLQALRDGTKVGKNRIDCSLLGVGGSAAAGTMRR